MCGSSSSSISVGKETSSGIGDKAEGAGEEEVNLLLTNPLESAMIEGDSLLLGLSLCFTGGISLSSIVAKTTAFSSFFAFCGEVTVVTEALDTGDTGGSCLLKDMCPGMAETSSDATMGGAVDSSEVGVMVDVRERDCPGNGEERTGRVGEGGFLPFPVLGKSG